MAACPAGRLSARRGGPAAPAVPEQEHRPRRPTAHPGERRARCRVWSTCFSLARSVSARLRSLMSTRRHWRARGGRRLRGRAPRATVSRTQTTRPSTAAFPGTRGCGRGLAVFSTRRRHRRCGRDRRDGGGASRSCRATAGWGSRGSASRPSGSRTRSGRSGSVGLGDDGVHPVHKVTQAVLRRLRRGARSLLAREERHAFWTSAACCQRDERGQLVRAEAMRAAREHREHPLEPLVRDERDAGEGVEPLGSGPSRD